MPGEENESAGGSINGAEVTGNGEGEVLPNAQSDDETQGDLTDLDKMTQTMILLMMMMKTPQPNRTAQNRKNQLELVLS